MNRDLTVSGVRIETYRARCTEQGATPIGPCKSLLLFFLAKLMERDANITQFYLVSRISPDANTDANTKTIKTSHNIAKIFFKNIKKIYIKLECISLCYVKFI